MKCNSCEYIEKVAGRNNYYNCSEYPLRLRLIEDLRKTQCGKHKVDAVGVKRFCL